MTTKTNSVRTGALVLALLMLPAAAFAVDGVILVDQAKAMAGNVTPGDAPGFPVTFTLPGSYRLSSNLVVPAGVAMGIQINADDVTIDLNGFALRGTGQFVAPFIGIDSTGRKRSKVRNGTIVGFSLGLQFKGAAAFVTLEQLVIFTLTANPNGGNVLGVGAIIGQTVNAFPLVRAVQSDGQIQLNCPGVVVDTVAESVVELNVPDNGVGVTFPVACKGSNVAH